MTSDTQYEERMAGLSAAFKGHLVSTQCELLQLQELLSAGKDIDSVYHDLHELVHSLAGSAGLFELKSIGDAAERAEVAVVQAIRIQEAPDQRHAVLRTMDDLAAEIKTAIN